MALDCAIVGAGAAGLYCTYRLARERPELAIGLFESTARIGGRLCSFGAEGAGAPAELGAYSFSDQDENLFGLARGLGLSTRSVHFSAHSHFLRGEWVGADPSEAGADGPYRLGSHERGRHPHTLLFAALAATCPDLAEVLSESGAGDLKAQLEHLRMVEVRGRALSDWGLWNLLAEQLSNEAYELLLATHGAASAFRSANACEAIALLLRESRQGQSQYRFSDGFSAFASALAPGGDDAARLWLNRRLISVGRSRAGLKLNVASADGVEEIEAKRVILALPKLALELIAFEEGLLGAQFLADLEAVSEVPATKLYLEFDAEWSGAPEAPEAPAVHEEFVTASFTDLPMRQCYRFLASKHAGQTGSLLMASFADDAAAAYWSALHGRTSAHEDCSVSPHMIAAARSQLALLFPGAQVPEPRRGWFADWSRGRRGAAWHAWAPGFRAWEVRDRMRQPNPEAPVFVCGEAYAQLQGWTEGAINNAEMMLERHFGMARPAWVRGDYAFEH